jgi:PAS domain S-box-containing protein
MTTHPHNVTQSSFWQPLITSLRILISLAALLALPLTAMELPKTLAPFGGTGIVGGYVLPPGTVVLYQAAGRWQRYTIDVVGAFCLVLVEALLIAGLLWQHIKRKKVETNLAISNERFRLAVEASKSVGWEWDLKNGQDSWFGDLQTMFGIASDTFVGRTADFYRYVHPEDRQRVAQAVADARQNRTRYAAEFRVVKPDESVRWVTATGQFYYGTNGDAERMLGMAVDITERKHAEQAFADVSRRLIDAQEQERTRIARELHDDIGQRLAMLAIEMEKFQQDSADLSAPLRSRIGELWQQTSEIASDIQSLSHELHSSKLEYLGIVSAMRGLCRELGEQQKVEIDFKTHDVVRPLPPDISLCLFRVLQEALHNSAKHSGVRNFEVQLWETGEEVHLMVSDSGTGFDRKAANESPGIGLISMEERLKMVGGTLSIESQPRHGTIIHARVPLHPGSASVAAIR